MKYYDESEVIAWQCEKCHQPLAMGPVSVEYLGNRFDIRLPKCEKCGLILVPEDLALGKMAEVEQILEDK
ncbi:MAG: DNA-binding protein [Desulfobacterales bacterium]|nr:DNA-binding protein [Desulfobacterales bacterium]